MISATPYITAEASTKAFRRPRRSDSFPPVTLVRIVVIDGTQGARGVLGADQGLDLECEGDRAGCQAGDPESRVGEREREDERLPYRGVLLVGGRDEGLGRRPERGRGRSHVVPIFGREVPLPCCDRSVAGRCGDCRLAK